VQQQLLELAVLEAQELQIHFQDQALPMRQVELEAPEALRQTVQAEPQTQVMAAMVLLAVEYPEMAAPELSFFVILVVNVAQVEQ
jgi:hypothetical protein